MSDLEDAPRGGGATGSPMLLVAAWLWVAAPFLYGLYELALTSRKLFLK